MKITKNTILITGGATGIAFSLAEHFLNADNEVIICGRRETKLKDADVSEAEGLRTTSKSNFHQVFSRMNY